MIRGVPIFLLGIRGIKPRSPLVMVQVDAVDGSNYCKTPNKIQSGPMEGVLIKQTGGIK